MKSTAKVLLAIAAVAGTLAVSDAWAQSRGGGGGGRGGSGASMGGGGSRGASMPGGSRGAAWSGGGSRSGGSYSGGRSYSGGSHGGHGGGYRHGGYGHYHGGYRPYYGYGYGYWPAWSFYWGIPVWSAAWWGYPYDYYYPRTYAYEAPQAAYPEYYMGPGPGSVPESTEVPRGEGTPSQGPLYMNYCESSKAYFPKVTACAEGWKFIAPQQ
jgi:hypothetical protein